MIKFSPPDIGEKEIEEVIDTLKSGWLTTGPKTKRFEKECEKYSDARSVAMNSATACMELALRFYGIGKGDEVIVPAYTYSATAAVVHHVGAKIVMVDIAPKDGEFNIDIGEIERNITSKTKAIIPVDIAGIPCDYDEIKRVVESKKELFKASNDRQKKLGRVLILSDAAHSFGATYKDKKIGNVADMSSFSLHAVKNLVTAEGGLLSFRDNLGMDTEDIYKEFMLLSLHGQNKDALSKANSASWEYDIKFPGFKCNMTDLAASLGLVQLERYDELLNKRSKIVKLYDKLLDKDIFIKPKHFSDYKTSSFHLYQLRIDGFDEAKRNSLIIKLNERGVPTNVHYKPLPLLTAYKDLGFEISKFGNSFNHYKNEITLPLHTLLSEDEVGFIVENLKNSI